MDSLDDVLRTYTDILTTAAVDSPRLSAEILLAVSLDISRAELLKRLIMTPGVPVPDDARRKANGFIARREKGEPVAYITGVKEFYGLDFAVTPATLIPRPDTETLVEAALGGAKHYFPCSFPSKFADFGTGSGAIAIALALHLPNWEGLAVDISSEALTVAEKNACTHNVNNLRFLLGNFCSTDFPSEQFDMIVSNPPYVSEEEYATLSYEIRRYEPVTALVPEAANTTGLEYLTTIMDSSAGLLKPGGMIFMEMGFTQGDALLRHSSVGGIWTDTRIIYDLAGLPRVFHAIRV